MKDKLFTSFAFLALFVVLASSSMASTTWYVNGVSGSDSNNCTSPTTACKTINQAISRASSGDSIKVATGIYSEGLSIGFNLTIVGSPTNPGTIIDGTGLVGTIVTVARGTHVTLSRLTIRNATGQFGGAINSSGSLTINNSTLSRNVAKPAGRFNVGGLGGAIFINAGTVHINNSTIIGNSARAGGGIYNAGTLMISNSTFSGNSASSGGGAGGGILNFLGLPTTLQNTIAANSPFGGNCGGIITSNGYNLSSDSSCNFNHTGDLNNTDPKLGPLQNNGGPTQTMALLSGSPAIDAGNPSGCTNSNGVLLKTDQRGKPRPDTEDTAGCDIGAYERQSD